MDKYFWIFLAVNAIVSTPMFWLLNKAGVSRGDVPKDSALTRYDRRYSVWWEETTLVVGNMFCFSIMDGAFASGALRSPEVEGSLLSATTLVIGLLLGSLATVKWRHDATKMYDSHESWGWQWSGPTPVYESCASTYHTGYFFVQASIIATGFTWLMWQPIDWNTRGLFLLGIAGYILCFVHFEKTQARFAAVYNRPR